MIEIDNFKLLAADAPDAMVATSPDGAVLCWSRGAEAMFEYPVEEVVGRSFCEVIFPSLDGQAPMLFNHEGGVREVIGCKRDGSLIYAQIITHGVRGSDGAVEFFATSIRDVTPLRVFRDSRMAAGRHGDLLEWAPMPVVVINEAERIVLMNAGAETLFGYKLEEILGKPLGVLIPDAPREVLNLKGAQGTGKPVTRAVEPMAKPHPIEIYGRRRDRSEFAAEMHAGVLEMDEGALKSLAICDLTLHRQREQALVDASRAKSEFLASMSHELRTPLNGILGFTEFLSDEKPGPLNGKQKEYLGDVYQSATHLLHLINDVLDLAKVESGKMSIHPQTFAVSKAVADVCAVVNSIAQKKQVQLKTTVPEELGEVRLDLKKFKQICYNLLANAVKFTGPGGRVEIGGALLEGECFAIWVEDTGVGIAQENMEKLFAEFEQFGAGALPEQEGSGLGLALTRKLVEFQHGSIAVESGYGRGSTFTVTLPRYWKETNDGTIRRPHSSR